MTDKAKLRANKRKPVISKEERRKYWLGAFLVTFVTINPLFLYRIPGVAEHLYLDQWIGFASFWQQNDLGLSLVEIGVWLVAYLPFYENVPFTSTPFEAVPKIITALVIIGPLVWAGVWIRRKFWIAFNNFNNGWALLTAIRKTAIIGGPIAAVMLAINYWGGVPFSIWNIVEVSLWVGLCVLASVVAVGMLWIFDLRYESGTLGVNTTMGDETEHDHDHDHDLYHN